MHGRHSRAHSSGLLLIADGTAPATLPLKLPCQYRCGIPALQPFLSASSKLTIRALSKHNVSDSPASAMPCPAICSRPYLYACLPARLPACLPARLPSQLPTTFRNREECCHSTGRQSFGM